MGYLDSGKAPPCNKTSCFAYVDGKCRVLNDTTFERDCPFYKDATAKRAEDALCRKRAKLWKENRKKAQIGTFIEAESKG